MTTWRGISVDPHRTHSMSGKMLRFIRNYDIMSYPLKEKLIFLAETCLGGVRILGVISLIDSFLH